MGFLDFLKEKFFTSPAPDLVTPHTIADYRVFNKAETYLYSPNYCKYRVSLSGGEHLIRANREGSSVVAFLHHGSRLLMNGVIHHQLGAVPVTSIASRRNLELCSAEEKAFWLGVHQRSAQSCNAPVIFYTDESPRGALRWLQTRGNTLTVSLDVREPGYPKMEYPFEFMGETIYLQTGAAKLALKAGAQFLPAAIEYDPITQTHHMVIHPPVNASDEYLTTQAALTCLEPYLARTPEQSFYEIVQTLKTPQDPDFVDLKPGLV